jgi:hypothetical protein
MIVTRKNIINLGDTVTVQIKGHEITGHEITGHVVLISEAEIHIRSKEYGLCQTGWRSVIRIEKNEDIVNNIKALSRNVDKMKQHVKLCKKNLKSNRVKCCAQCPFEDEICTIYPELKEMFENKRGDNNGQEEEK